MYPAIPFWPEEFLLKDQLLIIWSFLCMLLTAFPLLLLILCLIFVSMISICLKSLVQSHTAGAMEVPWLETYSSDS